ncbi:MAG TPA: hypothetical protein VHT03_02105 [Rhizomicrobium sp.]|jgi:hypothetical protein|nr:hypothetical protein [Rhizomicrobium sp.]
MSAAAPSARTSGSFERRFYLGTSLLFAALIFWTFARTYYLRTFFHRPPLPALLHIHGMVMTGWVVLLAVQSGLIASRRVQAHRWLGALGAGWAVLVVILGSVTTLHASAREVHNHTAFADMQVRITGLELIQMILFAGFAAAAISLRKRTAYHKRLMLLTVACMLPSALARLPIGNVTNLFILTGLDLFVLACAGIDTLRNRRLHPAFAWGAGALLLSINLAFYLTKLPAWIAFGRWLVT